MKRNRVIVALAAASAALLGLLAFLLADGGRPGSEAGTARPAGSRRAVSAPDAPFESWDGGGAPLDPAQAATVKAALEKLGAETAVRTAFTAGVDEPWPLPAAQQLFEACVPMVDRGKPEGSTADTAAVCACAVRAVQRVYPRERPQPVHGRVRRMFSETYRHAIDECMNPQ